ncbi:MAG TPA: hypothetical protein PLN56_00475 [Methanoregulaceae archaeon]|nr:MAG: hypothetical protein IPI71_05160 [Methanolinea sp.]HON80728.1 hypothetical protein [Methanoregulaceae archaeon]HPD09463.1 hypothetical protein [Methanoregulaceae archaeon]HRT14745.1 hypothetical protein [Methanoregulaceae archaeon]HRU30318.1 hypothetical protein [Methanoregulaceae archaeon]
MERSILLLFITVTIVSLMPGAAAQNSCSDAAAQVTVTRVSIDPTIFFEGDTGIITVEITNNGLESVAIRRATMYDADISVLSSSYDTTTIVGAGNSMQFSFTVRADVLPGIYYPKFSLDFRDAGYLRYPVQIRVENDPLEVSVLQKPDVFGPGRKERIDILVGNPRGNPVSGVVVQGSGEGIDITPSSYFIGNLGPDQAQRVSFNITPGQPGVLEFRADYKNGVNRHTSSVNIPLGFGISKTEANPLISNIIVQIENAKYVVTGDIYNAGLEVANSVVLSTGEGTVPVNPYQSYVVGSLEPDDFSSFELTFTAGDVTEVPIIVNYRDVDGNPFEKIFLVNIPAQASGSGKEPGIAIPIIALLIACAAAVGGAVWYSWKKS